MAKSTDAFPRGFNQVPPHLEARNFLQHIEKFTNNQRAQNTHAKSKSRHKFRKLCQNVKAWKSNPTIHLTSMKTAWYEWNIAGIKEISDKPGTYLFMRAILTDSEDSESEVSHRKPSVTMEESEVSHQKPSVAIDTMIPSQVSHQLSKKTLQMTDSITDDITTDGALITDRINDGISLTAKTATPKPAVNLNTFFSLTNDNTAPARTWAQRASTKIPPNTDAVATSSIESLAPNDSQLESQSVNLLDVEACGTRPESTKAYHRRYHTRPTARTGPSKQKLPSSEKLCKDLKHGKNKQR
jgi:hypothetical protein